MECDRGSAPAEGGGLGGQEQGGGGGPEGDGGRETAVVAGPGLLTEEQRHVGTKCQLFYVFMGSPGLLPGQ